VAEVLILLNPLDVSRRRRCHLADGTALLAWVDEHAPALGALQRKVFLNGHVCADADYLTRPGDEVLIAFTPGDAEAALFVLKVVIAYAIGYVLNQMFAPQRPSAANVPSPSQVYGIAPPKNQARLGQPIPVIYGSVVALPDFAAQPYVRFQQNDQYFYGLLCLGQGEYDVAEMLFGETSASVIPAGVVTWRVFLPSQHQSTFGTIQGLMGGVTATDYFIENMVTSPAVNDQELIAPNVGGVLVASTWYWALSNVYTTTSNPGGVSLVNMTPDQKLAALPQNPTLGTAVQVTLGTTGTQWTAGTYTATAYTPAQNPPSGALIPPPTWSGAGQNKVVGYFESCKKGASGTVLEFDFVFPNGLYTSDSSGNFANATVTVSVGCVATDPNTGESLGSEVVTGFAFTSNQNTPQRYTVSLTKSSARYWVRAWRATNTDGKATTSDRVLWTGLKHQIKGPPAGSVVYGNVTLIAVKVKATNGVAADAAASMRFRVTRRLRPLGDINQGTAPTSNPADAFVDIVTAPYGGNRPVTADELDLSDLTASRSAWDGQNGFNAVFDQPSTVWEALGLSVQTVHAAPLPVGSRMSLIHDQVQSVRAQLFTDANIVAGSLKVTAQFDRMGTPAGFKVNYRDPLSFQTASIYFPPNQVDYTTIDLFGCTDATVATQHAKLAQNKRNNQRMSIVFDCELEGLNILPGDRIGVQAGMVRWAQSARVVRLVGSVLYVDTALVFTPNATHAIQLRADTGAPTQVVGVTPGPDAYSLTFPSGPPSSFTFYGVNSSQEPTVLSFGVQNSEVWDWTVAKLTPNGDTVTVEALNYDPTIYDVTAAFTRAPIALEYEPEEVAS
jgi:hypothetical protein